MIDRFSGKYFFLSNYYEAPILYDGLVFMNNEAAFQAAKCINRESKLDFMSLRPNEAKRKGRRVELRRDWEEIKYDIMYNICRAKFMQNQDLKQRLIDTGDEYLEEGNDWGDTIWGTVHGIGQNNLGKILMKVRDELRNSNSESILTKEEDSNGFIL